MTNNNLIKEGCGIVYHYTSLDTLLIILDKVKDGKFIFHATYIFSMNDPTEFFHGFCQLWTLLPQIEIDLYKKLKDNLHIFNIDENLLDDKYKLSNMWKRNSGNEEECLKAHIEQMRQSYQLPFVVSLSCHEDSLPMWSTYGDQGNGVALGIETQSYYTKSIQKDGTMLLDFSKNDENELHSLLVSYDEISIYHPLAIYAQICLGDYLKSIAKQKNDKDSLFYYQLKAMDNITRFASAYMKNRAYKYEEESRLLFYRQDNKDVKFKIIATKEVLPYIEREIPISKLKKIVIGPCCDYKTVKLALKTRLVQLGIPFEDENIKQSNIPYRNL